MHCFHSHPTRLFLRYYDTVVFEWDFWVSDRQKNTKQFLLCLFENPKEQKRVFFPRIVLSFSYTLFGYSTSSQSVARLVVLRGRRISEALLVLVLLCVAPWLLPSTFQVPIRPIAEDSFQQGSRRRKKTNNWVTSKPLSQTHKMKSNCAVETMQDIIKANLHRKVQCNQIFGGCITSTAQLSLLYNKNRWLKISEDESKVVFFQKTFQRPHIPLFLGPFAYSFPTTNSSKNVM